MASDMIESRYGPDEDGLNDTDSGYDEMSLSTASIRSSIIAYEQENGRLYNAFRPGKYVMPNDATDSERQEIHHHSVRLLLEERPFWAPVEAPATILDVGTGNGLWAIAVADDFPFADVLGVDISPSFPTAVPHNLQWEIMDASDPWNFSQKFDLIHTRFMNGFSIPSWPFFYEQAIACLQPGGWLESQEFDLHFVSDDDTLPAPSALTKWATLWEEGVQKFGLTGRCHADIMKAQMEEAGFINVHVHAMKLPVGPWPRDKRLREAGLCNLGAIVADLSGLSLRVFTQGLGWSIDDLEIFLEEVRRELLNKRVHSYFPFYVLQGQKPP